MKKHLRLAMALTAAMGLAVCGLALTACDGSGHTHDWNDWETKTAATCTTDGEQTRSCKTCDKTETKTIDKTGHAVGDWTITTAAKCEAAGERTKKCSNCGETIQKEVVPATGHRLDEGRFVVRPTCEEFGVMEYACMVAGCGKTFTENVQPSGHKWEELRGTVHATCTEPGKINQKCEWCFEEEYNVPEAALDHKWQVYQYVDPTCDVAGYANRICLRQGCGETEIGPIPELGHIWQLVGDPFPTFESAGHGTEVCLRCNESGKEEDMPKLNANTPIDYSIAFTRANNENMDEKTVSFTILDENGNVVKTVTDFALKSTVCIYSVELLPANYTLRLDSAPEGIALETLALSYSKPVSTVYLTRGGLIPELPASARYKVGDRLHDYTYTTVDGKTITLSEFMKGKKVLILNFFYVHCTWCDFEFPGLQAAYEKYKDDIALLAIDPTNFDSVEAVQEYIQGGWKPSSYHPDSEKAPKLTFDFVYDATDKLNKFFKVSGYPTTAVIDREGVIREIHSGVMADYIPGTSTMDYTSSERMFGELFEKYINEPWNSPEDKTAGVSFHSYSAYEVVLPGKQEY